MLVSEQNQDGLASLLCALSFANNLGAGRPLDSGWRTAYVAALIADTANFNLEDRAGAYYGALVKNLGGGTRSPGVGNPRIALDIRALAGWLQKRLETAALSTPAQVIEFFCSALDSLGFSDGNGVAGAKAAEMNAKRLGLPEGVQEAVRWAWHRWDGAGAEDQFAGTAIPLASRALHLAQAVEAAHRIGGRVEGVEVAREGRGRDFDPDLVSAFLSTSRRLEFWRGLEGESVQETVLRLRPAVPFDLVPEARVDSLCRALADLTDIRSPHTWGHSSRVAAIAEAIARRLGLPETEVIRVRRAALVHDLGKATVSPAILGNQGRLSDIDWEAFRLHPYYTERILTRVDRLRYLGSDATSHHEWINGGGYYRQLAGDQIPLGGRILAVADTFVLHARRMPTLEVDQTMGQLRPMVGMRFDPACFQALADCLDGRAEPILAPRRQDKLGHLTARETEVLRHLALGKTNRDLAEALRISEKTIEHHLDHIYEKLEVSSRTSAVVYAVQNGIAGR